MANKLWALLFGAICAVMSFLAVSLLIGVLVLRPDDWAVSVTVTVFDGLIAAVCFVKCRKEWKAAHGNA